ncbi:MAG: glycosyltransferase family 2 protein [Blastochloris sp.]|nr:glycosyltransferase family 2 protein [Blastochloris sp.]
MPALVSILIPCRNAAPWLAETLQSALTQTWKPCEVILVDDASTDHSLAVASRYLSQGLKILSGSGRNAASARNLAYQACSGDYIQYLDADDLLAPDKIEHQVHLMQQGQSDQLISGVWLPFSKTLQDAHPFANPACRDFPDPLDFLLQHYNGGGMMQPAAWLTPRFLLDRVGPWNEELTLNDDGEFFARIMLASSGIRHCPQALSYYRRGHGSTLSRRKDPAALHSLKQSIQLNTTAMLHRKNSPEVHQAICNAWWKLAHDLYPADTSSSQECEAMARAHGTPTRPFECGPRLHLLVSLFGWRHAKRLAYLLPGF